MKSKLVFLVLLFLSACSLEKDPESVDTKLAQLPDMTEELSSQEVASLTELCSALTQVRPMALGAGIHTFFYQHDGCESTVVEAYPLVQRVLNDNGTYFYDDQDNQELQKFTTIYYKAHEPIQTFCNPANPLTSRYIGAETELRTTVLIKSGNELVGDSNCLNKAGTARITAKTSDMVCFAYWSEIRKVRVDSAGNKTFYYEPIGIETFTFLKKTTDTRYSGLLVHRKKMDKCSDKTNSKISYLEATRTK